MKLVRSKINQEVFYVFKDTDTVAIDDTKLSVTEKDPEGNDVVWENTSIKDYNFEILTNVTAEMFILHTVSNRFRYDADTQRTNANR